jgi:large subunit ribosomal protein L25
MSKQVALAASGRAGTGKGEARSLRRAGRVPAITYGAAIDAPIPVSVDGRELYHALNTEAGENAILRLDIDGASQLAIVREIQRHPVRREVLHVDFVTVDRNVKIIVEVPIVLEGEAPGADEGGVVDQVLFALPVNVLPLEVPDQIALDISDMQVGDVKRVADLVLPEGVETTEDPERSIVTCNVPALEVPEPEETATEVIDENADAAGVVAPAGTEAPAEEPPAGSEG